MNRYGLLLSLWGITPMYIVSNPSEVAWNLFLRMGDINENLGVNEGLTSIPRVCIVTPEQYMRYHWEGDGFNAPSRAI